jgi:hypothetical protein
MQAWNSVKVTSEESIHAGRVGTVARIERRNGLELVQVWLDEVGRSGEAGHRPAEMEPFAAVELALL